MPSTASRTDSQPMRRALYINIGGQDWIVGGAVYLDTACSTSVPVVSTH